MKNVDKHENVILRNILTLCGFLTWKITWLLHKQTEKMCPRYFPGFWPLLLATHLFQLKKKHKIHLVIFVFNTIKHFFVNLRYFKNLLKIWHKSANELTVFFPLENDLKNTIFFSWSCTKSTIYMALICDCVILHPLQNISNL